MLLKGFLYIAEKKFVAKLKAQLTFVNPEYLKKMKQGLKIGDTDPIFHLFRKVEAKNGSIVYQVPRYTFKSIPDCKKDLGFNKVSFSVREKICKPDGTFLVLNSEQGKTIFETLKILRDQLGAVVVAKPGEGKTVMSLYIAAILGQKTLILAHKNSLLKQWRENILMITDVKDEEIGILQQGLFKDGKIVLGSVPSLMRGTISNGINKLFGFVIMDETHRIGAREFLKSFTRFNSTYRLGLSATPNREDELEKLYFLHTSANLIYHKTLRNVAAKYVFYDYKRETKWKFYPSYIPYKIGLIHNIISDEDRNSLLVSLIIKANKEGRSIIILSERIKHLKELMELTKSKVSKGVNIVRFFGAESLSKTDRRNGIKMEKVIDPTSDQLNKANIIFATYKKAMEGIDIPHLDTIMFATPLSSRTTIEQAVGRIERQYENKKAPQIIDIRDYGNNLLEGMANKRISIYEEVCSK